MSLFKKLHPSYKKKQIDDSIKRAIKYLEDIQNPDGSWYGYRGICYIYATWFAVEGLVAAGKNYDNSPALRKACLFLLSKQLSSGGWGESLFSNQNKVNNTLN